MNFHLPAISFLQAPTMNVNFCYNHFITSIRMYAATKSGINNTVFDILSSDNVINHISDWAPESCIIFSTEMSHACCPYWCDSLCINMAKISNGTRNSTKATPFSMEYPLLYVPISFG